MVARRSAQGREPAAISRRDWLRIALAGAASAIAQARPAVADGGKPGGTIYLTALDQGEAVGASRVRLYAFDPETGAATVVIDGCEMRPRVSPDGRVVAFVRDHALWTRPVAGAEPPRKVLAPDRDEAGGPPVWSPDGRRIIHSRGIMDPLKQQWMHTTLRFNVDGEGREELPIPPEDNVQDGSPDGEWLVTASSRGAKIGWQLYVMRPDGTDQLPITRGGNPFYARFSPDGRRVLYTDGGTPDRRGIWVVGRDGNGRRKVLATGREVASACWSPDGLRIAVAFRDYEGEGRGNAQSRIEVMDIDRQHRNVLSMPSMILNDMPDWR